MIIFSMPSESELLLVVPAMISSLRQQREKIRRVGVVERETEDLLEIIEAVYHFMLAVGEDSERLMSVDPPRPTLSLPRIDAKSVRTHGILLLAPYAIRMGLPLVS